MYIVIAMIIITILLITLTSFAQTENVYWVPKDPAVAGYGVPAEMQKVDLEEVDPYGNFQAPPPLSPTPLNEEERSLVLKQLEALGAEEFTDREDASKAITEWLSKSESARDFVSKQMAKASPEARWRIKAALSKTQGLISYGYFMTVIHRSIRDSQASKRLKKVFDSIKARFNDAEREALLKYRKIIWQDIKGDGEPGEEELQLILDLHEHAVSRWLGDGGKIRTYRGAFWLSFEYEDEIYFLKIDPNNGHAELMRSNGSREADFEVKRETLKIKDIVASDMLLENVSYPDISYCVVLHSFPETKEYRISVGYFFSETHHPHFNNPYDGPKTYLSLLMPKSESYFHAIIVPPLLVEGEAWLR